MSDPNPAPGDRRFLGVSRKQRFKIYRWTALAMVLGFGIWTWVYLQPGRWYKYTDHVSFEQSARDVKLGHVIWEPAQLETKIDEIHQASISSNGKNMVYSTGKEKVGESAEQLRV